MPENIKSEHRIFSIIRRSIFNIIRFPMTVGQGERGLPVRIVLIIPIYGLFMCSGWYFAGHITEIHL